MDAAEWDRYLDEHPDFKRLAYDFLMLLDAKRVLERHKPPTYETAAAYLEEVGRAIMMRAGIPDEFVQACVNNQPPQPQEE